MEWFPSLSGKRENNTERDSMHNLYPQRVSLNRGEDVVASKSKGKYFREATEERLETRGQRLDEINSGQGWLPGQSNCKGLTRATVCSHSTKGPGRFNVVTRSEYFGIGGAGYPVNAVTRAGIRRRHTQWVD
jgi:hypothetical protein